MGSLALVWQVIAVELWYGLIHEPDLPDSTPNLMESLLE